MRDVKMSFMTDVLPNQAFSVDVFYLPDFLNPPNFILAVPKLQMLDFLCFVHLHICFFGSGREAFDRSSLCVWERSK